MIQLFKGWGFPVLLFLCFLSLGAWGIYLNDRVEELKSFNLELQESVSSLKEIVDLNDAAVRQHIAKLSKSRKSLENKELMRDLPTEDGKISPRLLEILKRAQQ